MVSRHYNIEKGIESEIPKSKDMELVAIFTRRNPESLVTKSSVPIININDINNWKDKIDVVIMCGGSATDLPNQVPEIAKSFNTVSFSGNFVATILFAVPEVCPKAEPPISFKFFIVSRSKFKRIQF